jgi:hypothetical protein
MVHISVVPLEALPVPVVGVLRFGLTTDFLVLETFPPAGVNLLRLRDLVTDFFKFVLFLTRPLIAPVALTGLGVGIFFGLTLFLRGTVFVFPCLNTHPSPLYSTMPAVIFPLNPIGAIIGLVFSAIFLF